MRKKETIIHIGSQRTGNSFFQDNILCNLKNTFYLGKYKGKHTNKETQSIIEQIVYQDSLEFSLSDCKKKYNKIIKQANSKRICLSNEIFTCEGNVDRFEIAKRLFYVFGPAKIIYLIRNQEDLLKAIFYKNIEAIGCSIFDFRQYIKKNYSNVFFPEKNRASLDFYKILKTYKYFFGEKNVFCFSSEKIFSGDYNEIKKLSLAINANEKKLYTKIKNNKSSQKISKKYLFFQKLFYNIKSLYWIATKIKSVLPFKIWNKLKNNLKYAKNDLHFQKVSNIDKKLTKKINRINEKLSKNFKIKI